LEWASEFGCESTNAAVVRLIEADNQTIAPADSLPSERVSVFESCGRTRNKRFNF